MNPVPMRNRSHWNPAIALKIKKRQQDPRSSRMNPWKTIHPLSLNRYNYVYSSYLNYVDPSGNRLDDDVASYRQFTNELNHV